MSFDTLHNPHGKVISPLAAYQRAMLSQLQPAMLALSLLPVLVFALLWGWFFWATWAYWLTGLDKLLGMLPWVGNWFAHAPGEGSGWFATTLTVVLMVLIYAMLTLVCALTFVSTFGMPFMLRHVARDYPDLARLRGGSIGGSIRNVLGAVAWFTLFSILTLPLWFVPLLGWLVPIFLFGLLNARVLRYDALSEHASVQEMEQMKRAPRLYWRVLGFGGALLNVVPLLWFFSTTLTGLAFIHYGFAALQAQRAEAVAKPQA
jgi:hypothetical protein